MKRKIFAWMLALLFVCGLVKVPVEAASEQIRKTTYEGNGEVDVDFNGRVQYKNVKVTVKAPDGTKLKAVVTDKDSDDLDFKVTGLEPNTKYTYTISGVRFNKSGSFMKVSGTFKTPKTELAIRKVKYDREDKELEIEFFSRVQFKNVKVTLIDENGGSKKLKVLEKDRDELEVRAGTLKRGHTYTIQVQGVRQYKKGSYTTVTKSFTVK
ncbi:MAG: copper resistance protein CopC [Clostridiales bacterium]|nr:copper resistance protein CopC [Clostridiales bacterium]